jgi:hypothetical protein
MTTYGYFTVFGIIQLIHSQEEIWTGFHKKWFLFTMPRWVFVAWEACLSAVIITYMLRPHLAGATGFMLWFIFAMLLNGMEHVIWAAVKKSYVPGLATAPLFILLFIPFYDSLVKVTLR